MSEARAIRVPWLLVRHAFRIPSLAAAVTDVRVLQGDCLCPFLVADDLVWFDRQREPRDGDLVIVAMLYRRYGGIMGAGQRIDRHDAVKQLRIVDGERFLAAADGAVHADAHEVLGPVVAWRRPGWWRRPALKSMRFDVPDHMLTSRPAASEKRPDTIAGCRA